MTREQRYEEVPRGIDLHLPNHQLVITDYVMDQILGLPEIDQDTPFSEISEALNKQKLYSRRREGLTGEETLLIPANPGSISSLMLFLKSWLHYRFNLPMGLDSIEENYKLSEADLTMTDEQKAKFEFDHKLYGNSSTVSASGWSARYLDPQETANFRRFSTWICANEQDIEFSINDSDYDELFLSDQELCDSDNEDSDTDLLNIHCDLIGYTTMEDSKSPLLRVFIDEDYDFYESWILKPFNNGDDPLQHIIDLEYRSGEMHKYISVKRLNLNPPMFEVTQWILDQNTRGRRVRILD